MWNVFTFAFYLNWLNYSQRRDGTTYAYYSNKSHTCWNQVWKLLVYYQLQSIQTKGESEIGSNSVCFRLCSELTYSYSQTTDGTTCPYYNYKSHTNGDQVRKLPVHQVKQKIEMLQLQWYIWLTGSMDAGTYVSSICIYLAFILHLSCIYPAFVACSALIVCNRCNSMH